MIKSLNGKSVLVGVALTLLTLKFVVPRVPALAGLAAAVR